MPLTVLMSRCRFRRNNPSWSKLKYDGLLKIIGKTSGTLPLTFHLVFSPKQPSNSTNLLLAFCTVHLIQLTS